MVEIHTSIGICMIFGLLCQLNLYSCSEVCCDEDIGCFTNDPPYHMFPLPRCPSEMATKYYLWVRNSPEKEDIVRGELPKNWSPHRQTVIIAHGWMESGLKKWQGELTDLLLKKDDYNIVIVDWVGGSRDVYYPKSASSIRTVAAEVGFMIKLFMANGQEFAPYCIGFSLGAHMCGQIGRIVPLERITGLDPAGPWFNQPEVSLSPDCAKFVDVIHTNGNATIGSLGIERPLGHVDFYPNGATEQPGCIFNYNVYQIPFALNPFEELAESFMPHCSHRRALRYFMDGIENDEVCNYRTVQRCHVVSDEIQWCAPGNPVPQEMGFYSNLWPGRGTYYLKTFDKTPYCME